MIINSTLRRVTFLSICLSFCLVVVRNATSQEGSPSDPRRPIGPEDTSRTPQEVKEKPYFSPVRPVTCEEVRVYLEDTAERARAAKDVYLIVIARRGVKETSRELNRKRLTMIRHYFERHDLKFVTAEGPQVAGSGRIEMYVKGKLLYSIPVKTNNRLPCNLTGVG